ncbi:MAG TPA: hypothetical protein VKA18_14085 [Alphaproteobacteria bacterium]|nr:hypothetical protein [Alphaproteobacteria bacterium]
MSYTLEQFAADCREALKADPGEGGMAKCRDYVSQACKDPEFVTKYLPDNPDKERTVIYEDPELGFCICAHVYEGPKQGSPHDHGPTWAIYGQAIGETEMTDWEIVEPAKGDKPAKVKLSRKYKLEPGDAYYYPVGAVHAPYRADSTRLIRIEGQDTMKLSRTKVEPVDA